METRMHAAVLDGRTHNTCITYRNETGLILFLLKVFRHIDIGLNPELEMGVFLTEATQLEIMPPVAGGIDFKDGNGQNVNLGVLQGYIYNEGDAWQYTLDSIGDFFDRVLVAGLDATKLPAAGTNVIDIMKQELPTEVSNLIGHYLDSARLIGQRTAELHVTLAGAAPESGLEPEKFTSFFQRGLYHDLLTSINLTLLTLRKRISNLPEPLRPGCQELLGIEPQCKQLLRRIRDAKIDAMRIRIHGHLHLGQLLYTGRDFAILDFEGDPARPLSERRIKRSPLRDFAAMLRSFHYASKAAFTGQAVGLVIRPEDRQLLEPAAQMWFGWVAWAYTRGYFHHISEARLLPTDALVLQSLLDAYLLDKAADEILFDLANRPAWIISPVSAMLDILKKHASHN